MANNTGKELSLPRQSIFFENSRVIKNGAQIVQEPRVAKLAIFEATSGVVRVSLTINVFLSLSEESPSEDKKMLDKFQMILTIAEHPTAALHTGESINTFSFNSLAEMETWWSNGQANISNYVSMAFGKQEAAAVDKVKYVFQDFINDRQYLEEEATAAHTKFANRQRKGPQKKVSHSHS